MSQDYMIRRVVFVLLVCISAGWTSAGTVERSEQDAFLINVDHRDEDIRSLLRDIADVFELNLVVPEHLTGETTVILNGVTWRQAFETALKPFDYTFVEEGSLVKLIPNDKAVHWPTESSSWFGIPWAWVYGVGAICLVIVVCHIAVFIGVMVDKPPGGVRFAPKLVWALFVLWGGVVSLLAYWLIHHSNLRPERRD